jgi:hypothetical protein
MKTLETGLWLAKNRKNLKNLLIFFLIVISVLAWGYGIYNIGEYFLVSKKQDTKMVTDLVGDKTSNQNLLLSGAAKDLIYSSVGIISNNGEYDLYTQIKNQNNKYWGSFDYCFTIASGEKSCGSDFILPGDKKYILSLAQTFTKQLSSVTFTTSNLSWHKIDSHVIPDWTVYRNDRLDISIKNSIFIPAVNNEISEKVELNTLSFTATNNSAFNYWETPFIIVLSSNGKVVGVNKYTIGDFASYDSREIKITWPGSIGGVNGINIIPDINIMDPKIYQ